MFKISAKKKKLKTQIKLCNIIMHIIMFLYYSYYYFYYQSYYYVLPLLLLEVAMQSFLYATKQSYKNIITIIVCPLPNQIWCKLRAYTFIHIYCICVWVTTACMVIYSCAVNVSLCVNAHCLVFKRNIKIRHQSMFVSIKTLHLSHALLYVLIEWTKIVNTL